MPDNRTPTGRRLLAASALVVVLASGCATSVARGAPGTKLNVVAAESVLGSIAGQLGGDKVEVTSLIDNPATDPHDYEPTTAAARATATAQVVVVNGVGYDTWASKLLKANPVSGRQIVDVGDVVGAASGGNPHRWYDPADVRAVASAITAALTKADPADAMYFAARQAEFTGVGLASYDKLIADIRATYAGTPVGASESIVAMLTPALGLDLVTPPSFLRAISDGTDPTAGDKATIDRQIARRQIAVYIYNSQNATPDVRAQVDAAKAAGIPVVAITETLYPATASFQDWQCAQLRALRAALAQAAKARQ